MLSRDQHNQTSGMVYQGSVLEWMNKEILWPYVEELKKEKKRNNK